MPIHLPGMEMPSVNELLLGCWGSFAATAFGLRAARLCRLASGAVPCSRVAELVAFTFTVGPDRAA